MKYIISIFILMFIFTFLTYALRDLKKDYKLSRNKKKNKVHSINSSKFQVNPNSYKMK